MKRNHVSRRGNDEIIGKAFKCSLTALAGVTLVVMAILPWQGRWSGESGIEKAALTGPGVHESPPDIAPPATGFTDITHEAGTGFVHVNRDAIGAWIEASANGVTRQRQVMPTRSYLSRMELSVTSGPGDTATVDQLTVFWPDGAPQSRENAKANPLLEIKPL